MISKVFWVCLVKSVDLFTTYFVPWKYVGFFSSSLATLNIYDNFLVYRIIQYFIYFRILYKYYIWNVIPTLFVCNAINNSYFKVSSQKLLLFIFIVLEYNFINKKEKKFFVFI